VGASTQVAQIASMPRRLDHSGALALERLPAGRQTAAARIHGFDTRANPLAPGTRRTGDGLQYAEPKHRAGIPLDTHDTYKPGYVSTQVVHLPALTVQSHACRALASGKPPPSSKDYGLSHEILDFCIMHADSQWDIYV
jgi:hypothetical protein